MENKKVFFRTDASVTIGYGHFARCLALADMLKDDFDCTFFTQTPTEYQKKEILNICKLVELPSNDRKFDVFLGYLKGDEIVVLDNYFFSSDYQKYIKNIGNKLICIGPNDRHYYSDIVLNFAETDANVFSVESYTRVFCGLEWSILRKPFRNKRKNSNRKGIVVCFGGTDQFCLTEKVLKVLNPSDVHIIATSVISSIRLDNWRQQGCSLHINASAEEIANLFDTCEVAILSSSTICVEAISRGISVIAGYYVENQERIYSLLVKLNHIYGIGNLLTNDVHSLLSNAMTSYCLNNYASIDFCTQKEKYIQLFRELC